MVESAYFTAGLNGIQGSDKNLLRSVIIDLETKIVVNGSFSFHVLLDPSVSGENIYSFNSKQILKSGALVAFCDFPEVGLEIMMAHNAGKDIIILHKSSMQPSSRMLLEFVDFFKYPVLKYFNSESASDIVRRILAKLNS